MNNYKENIQISIPREFNLLVKSTAAVKDFGEVKSIDRILSCNIIIPPV